MNQLKNIDVFYSVIKEVFELIELVKCPVCLEVCSEPTILNCKHTFCLKCIENTFKETPLGKRSTCPVCRKVLNKRQKYRNEQAEQLIKYVNGVSSNLQNICEFNIFADNSFINFLKRYSSTAQTNDYSRPSTSTNVSTKSKPPVIPKLNSFKSASTRESPEQDAFDKLFAASKNVAKKSIRTYKNKKKEGVKENEPEEIFDKVVEFEDSKSKEDIIKWLTNSQNQFDRVTQTTQGSIDEYYPEEEMLSISQNTRKARQAQQAKKCRERRRCRSLGINANTRIKSSLKRRTLGVLSNEHEKIEISDSESEGKQLNTLVNLVEDDFINTLNTFVEPKHVNKKSKEVVGESSGWSRMKKMDKKGKRTTRAQTLNISLASQKKNDVSATSFKDVSLVNVKKNAVNVKKSKSGESKNDVIVVEDEVDESNKNDDIVQENVIAVNKNDGKHKENIVEIKENEKIKENVIQNVVEEVQTSLEVVTETQVIEDINNRIPYVKLTEMESFFEKHIPNLVIENPTQSECSTCNSNSQNNIIESSIPTAPHERQNLPQIQSESPQKQNFHSRNNDSNEFEIAIQVNNSNHQNSSTDSDLFTKATQQILFDDFKIEKGLTEYIEQYIAIKQSLERLNTHTEKSEKFIKLIKVICPIFDKLKPEIDKIIQALSKLDGGSNPESGSLSRSLDNTCKEFTVKATQTEVAPDVSSELFQKEFSEMAMQTEVLPVYSSELFQKESTEQAVQTEVSPLVYSSELFQKESTEQAVQTEVSPVYSSELFQKELTEKAVQTEVFPVFSSELFPTPKYLEKCVQTDALICVKCKQQISLTNSKDCFTNSPELDVIYFNTQDAILESEICKTIKKLEIQKEFSDSSKSSDISKGNSYSGRQNKETNTNKLSTSSSGTANKKTTSSSGTQNYKSNQTSETQSEKTITQIMKNLEVNTQNSDKAGNIEEKGNSEDIVLSSEDFVPRRSERLTLGNLSRKNSGNVTKQSKTEIKEKDFLSANKTLKPSLQTNKDFISAQINNQLPSRVIKAVEIVASTSKGLSHFNNVDESFNQYEENDIIPETEDLEIPTITVEDVAVASTSNNLKKLSNKHEESKNNSKHKAKSKASLSYQVQSSKESTKDLDSPNNSKKLYNVDLSSINPEGDPILEEIFKENVQISSPDSDLIISIEHPVKKKLQYPEMKGESNKFKRIRLLSSDSESDGGNLKKKAKNMFIRDDVSIHFDTETQLEKSLEDEVIKVTSLGSSDFNMDYVDQVWNKIDKGLLGVDLVTSPPKKKVRTVSPEKTKTQDILEKCDQIINDVTNKMVHTRKIDEEKEKIMELLEETVEDIGIEHWQDSFVPDEECSNLKKTVIENKKGLNYMIEEFTDENTEKEMEMFNLNSPRQNKDENISKNVINILQDLTVNKKDASLRNIPETNIDDLQHFDVDKAIEAINTQALNIKKKEELEVIEDSDQELFKSDSEPDVIESTPPNAVKKLSQSSNLIEDICAIPPPFEFQDFESSNNTLVPETSQIIQSNRLLTSKISDSEPFFNSLSPITKTTKPKVINIGLPSTSFARKHSSTPKTQKQSSLKKFLKKSNEKPEELFKVKFKSKPCIACTRLSKEQIIAISSLTNKHLATYSSVFNSNTTHMIVSTNDNNCIKDHTMKFVSAVAAGIWVLNFKWVQECILQKTIVPEEPYEVLDVSGIPGPKESRLNRNKRPLFKGFKIHAASPFLSTTQSDVENIVKLLGGKVASTLDELLDSTQDICLIITETRSSQDFELYEGWLETLKVVTVDIEWLSRSVGQYKLMSLRRFALCSDDTLGDLGYPQELLEMVPYSFTPSTFN